MCVQVCAGMSALQSGQSVLEPGLCGVWVSGETGKAVTILVNVFFIVIPQNTITL